MFIFEKKVKVLNRIITFALLVCLSFTIMQTKVASAKSSNDGKEFYTTQINDELMEYFEDNFTSISPIIANDLVNYGITTTQLTVGSPISVDGNDAFFYVPLLYNGEVVYIVCLSETGDSNTPYAMTYGRMFSDELNNLPNGNYRFVVSNERVFVVGDEITIQVYGPTDDYIEDLSEQENYVQKPTFDKVDISLLEAVELTEINNYMTLPISTRGITSKSLSIPYVANGGKFGYCWLSAPASLILYYGRSVDLINAHTTMHGYAHTRYDCPGGSLQESYGVLNIYGGVTGTVIGATRTWGQVMDSINNSSPLLTGWGRYQNNSRIAGHAMVICGYSFNDTALTITYTIRDSNSTSYTYVTTPISTTTVYYVIGGYNYKWDCTIYDIY